MEHLDARLGTIAAMVPRCRAVADIGCDHGLLVAALLEGGRCDYGIAADINPMPLEKARQELFSCRHVISCLPPCAGG